MKVLIQLRRPRRAFAPLERTWPSLGSLGVSLSAHTALAWSLFTFVSFAPPAVAPRTLRIPDGTEIRLGDHIYYVAKLAMPERSKRPVRSLAPQRDAAKARKPGRAPEKIAPPQTDVLEANAQKVDAPPAPKPTPRTFIPPEIQRHPVAEETLIQPDSPPELRPVSPNLPSFQAWAAHMPKIPMQFIAPGQRRATVAQPQTLAEPGFDVWRSDSTSDQTARLTLPPVRIPVESAPAPQVPQLPEGDPVNIVSVTDHPAPPTETLKIPPGNSVARAQSGQIGQGAAGGGNLTRSDSPGGSSAARLDTASASSSASADSAGSDSTGSPTARGAAAARNGTPTGGPAGAVSPAPRKETIITRPANGHFDAVIVQSSPLDLFPEGRHLLSGRPVYTVYVAVGTAKDWALYYCVPPEKSNDSGGSTGVIQLASATPVKAPWPTRIVRPAVSLPKYQKYALLHAYLTEAGRFRDVRIVSPGVPETDQAILSAISGWEFRPADRDGVPIGVEILLAIPAVGL